jgi:hypothetical protein
MRPTTPLFLALLVGQGFDRAPAPTDAAPPTAKVPPPAGPGPTTSAKATTPISEAAGATPTADAVFKALTAHTWNTDPPGERQRSAPDYRITTFGADGTWSTEHITDHAIPSRSGRWNLQRDAAGDWNLCRDDGRRDLVILNADGTLTLTFGRLYPARPLNPDPRWTAGTLPAITLGPDVRRIVGRLTARGWKRANDLDLRMEPTHVRFLGDWTYVATYRQGACTSKGRWYATIGEINAHNPRGRCDDRPGTGGDQLTAEVIDDRRILVNGDLYVPEDQPVGRGTLWALQGYDPVTAIRIEYDMPVRAGVPIRLDVTITNGDNAPLTLERFSLTGRYENYGRDAGDPGKALLQPGELAAADLNRVELASGKSHAFTLSATFPGAGVRWVYFNAMISGARQNWDTHCAHELTIGE